MRSKKVVITGLGPLTPIGVGKRELWDSLIRGRTGLNRHRYCIDGKLIETFFLHKIDKFNLKNFNISERELSLINQWKHGERDIELEYFLASIALAIEDSGISRADLAKTTGLILTQEMAGIENFYEKILIDIYKNYHRKRVPSIGIFEKKLYKICENRGYDLQTFMYIYFVSACFGIHKHSLFINNACASGLYAIEQAAQEIKIGNANVMIVSAGDYPRRAFKYRWFKNRNLYAENGLIRPFCKDSSGIVFGEGASALVLEEMNHALKREAHIYGEYLGGGFSQEAWKVTVPDVVNNHYRRVINEAIINAKIEKKEIDFVAAHGVGIRLTDKHEARSIDNVFENILEKPPVVAFKPYIGHNLGGSALIETIIALLCLENNYLLPVPNIQSFDNLLRINVVKKGIKKKLKTLLKIACGFAGFNGAAVFTKELNIN